MIEVSFVAAFIGGLLTFLAPCTLPLIPAYIGFISGTASSGSSEKRSLRIFSSAVFFVFGFTLIFVFFGLATGVLGKFLTLYRAPISQIGGVFIIIFGLATLGVYQFPRLFQGGVRLPRFLLPGSLPGSFFLGLLFALGWSPCLGPILGTILLLAASSGGAVSGAFLLFVYAFGLAIPFLLIAYFYGSSFTYVRNMERWLPLIGKLSGIFLIVIGVLVLLGEFGSLSAWGRIILEPLNFDALINYM